MGYYIETSKPYGKANEIMRDHDAIDIEQPKTLAEIPEGMALICVVGNRGFDAAALCFDQAEFEAFSDPQDCRPHNWLVMDQALAHKLAGYKQK